MYRLINGVMTLIDIGFRIRKLRKERGVSAKEIAISLAVSPSFISGIEKGTNKCSLENLDKICQTLNISISDFFADTQEPEQELLPLEVRQIFEKVKNLHPDKLKVLNAVLDSWID